MQVKKNFLKGLSPLVATVLLIAFVVGVAGIIATWLTGFTRTTTEIVTTQSDLEVTCSFGSVSLKTLKYSQPFLSGVIENTGQIGLGNFSLSIVFQNATSEKFDICKSGSAGTRCTISNLSLLVSDQQAFNVSINGSNYDTIRLFTNCTGVFDEANRGDVS